MAMTLYLLNHFSTAGLITLVVGGSTLVALVATVVVRKKGSIEECVGRVCGHCSCGSISWTGPQHSITSAAAALAE
ncbi:MAG: hypothetical protein ACRDYA_10530 [Egibacteraceae bacterium]